MSSKKTSMYELSVKQWNPSVGCKFDCVYCEIGATKKNMLVSPQFRIRKPLLADMIGWLARQSSRLGHVSVKP